MLTHHLIFSFYYFIYYIIFLYYYYCYYIIFLFIIIFFPSHLSSTYPHLAPIPYFKGHTPISHLFPIALASYFYFYFYLFIFHFLFASHSRWPSRFFSLTLSLLPVDTRLVADPHFFAFPRFPSLSLHPNTLFFFIPSYFFFISYYHYYYFLLSSHHTHSLSICHHHPSLSASHPQHYSLVIRSSIVLKKRVNFLYTLFCFHFFYLYFFYLGLHSN